MRGLDIERHHQLRRHSMAPEGLHHDLQVVELGEGQRGC